MRARGPMSPCRSWNGGGDHGEEETDEATRGLFKSRGTDDRDDGVQRSPPRGPQGAQGDVPHRHQAAVPHRIPALLRAGLPLLRGSFEQEASRDEVPEVRLHLGHPKARVHAVRRGDRLGGAPADGQGPHLHHLLFRRRGVPEGDPLPPRAGGVRRGRHAPALPIARAGATGRYKDRNEDQGEVPPQFPAEADRCLFRPRGVGGWSSS